MQHHVDSSKVRGKGNSVILVNREILSGREDARICFTFLSTTRISVKFKEVFY